MTKVKVTRNNEIVGIYTEKQFCDFCKVNLLVDESLSPSEYVEKYNEEKLQFCLEAKLVY